MFPVSRIVRTALASVAVSAFCVSTALAADLIDATSPEAILDVAKGFGSAQLTTDSAGDPMISGRIDGTRYSIMFYGCKDGRNCTDVQFGTAWSKPGMSLEEINRWNRTARFSKAFLDDENDPVLEMAVNLNAGVTRKNLEDTIDWWATAVNAFRMEVLN
ncbi:YbjN domain-containing protein [Phaeovibrio sulfidiphilus]|uniref:YbjN domain-containing protein n=1 Tax=Phaeovibrio sulfidiphilus TaxID=1220600 RepID=A0A8J6YW94_9PROT|nr:YbjN domain-containing protein [Phaeovibrio sulfidiphilus]MBE1237604.1 YbjN domain-containing protein [Phaeovibrio sulfidiphilus]